LEARSNGLWAKVRLIPRPERRGYAKTVCPTGIFRLLTG